MWRPNMDFAVILRMKSLAPTSNKSAAGRFSAVDAELTASLPSTKPQGDDTLIFRALGFNHVLISRLAAKQPQVWQRHVGIPLLQKVLAGKLSFVPVGGPKPHAKHAGAAYTSTKSSLSWHPSAKPSQVTGPSLQRLSEQTSAILRRT